MNIWHLGLKLCSGLKKTNFHTRLLRSDPKKKKKPWCFNQTVMWSCSKNDLFPFTWLNNWEKSLREYWKKRSGIKSCIVLSHLLLRREWVCRQGLTHTHTQSQWVMFACVHAPTNRSENNTKHFSLSRSRSPAQMGWVGEFSGSTFIGACVIIGAKTNNVHTKFNVNITADLRTKVRNEVSHWMDWKWI